jgi:adenylate cyclase
LKTANLAIVFTDIQGFTERTSRQTLEENQRLLQVHHQLLAPLFKAFGGRIIKSIGDAFLVTVESPTQAVLSGRAIQMNKAEVPSQEVGAFELKGIPGRIRVFRVPHAPYRVEAPTSPEQPAPPVEVQPPFGNLALSRVPESQLAPGSDIAATAAAIGQRAVDVGGQLVERTSAVIQSVKTGRRPPPPRVLAAVGVGGLMVLLGSALVLTRQSPAEKAIVEVTQATSREQKREALARAGKLIEGLEDPAERAWLSGQLDEAVERPDRAVKDYITAAKAGSGRAEDRLVELLGHEKCAVRSEAAEALGILKLASARGELEALAEKGGPDEESGGLLGLGCDSKKAAKKALERIDR